MSQRFWIPLLLLAAGVGGIGLGRVFFTAAPESAEAVVLQSGMWLSPPRPLPEFQLVDQNGAIAGRERFKGHWTLVFFGFTHCPDACPTTLALLATVRRELGKSMPADRVPRVLLISVDPERDTSTVLKTYLSGFDPEFVGLTGQPDAVRALATTLGMPYRKLPMEDDYMMDHSTSILLVNPEGHLAALFTAPHVADVLISDLRNPAVGQPPHR